MASKYAVGIAAFLQIVLRVSFFIEQRSDLCSTAPTLASWIFLIAFLDILLDICIYPVRYMHLPYICQIIAETLVTVFLAEFGSLMVWCNIEKITCKMCKSLLLLGMPSHTYYAWETFILGTVTTSTSLAVLLFVGQATDHYYFMRKNSMRMCRNIKYHLSNIWSKMHCKKRSAINLRNCEGRLDDELEMDTEVIYQPQRGKYKRNRNRSRGRSRSRK